jgi:hypothetical protein
MNIYTTNTPLKNALISSFGVLFQLYKLLVQSLVPNVVPFVFPPSVFLSKTLHRAVVA